jgi:AbrB family looped-hinge helix DNA binding protein
MPKQWVRKIDRYGRVTIPAELRRALGLKPGSRFVLVPAEDHIILYPLRIWKRLQRNA